MTVVAFGSVRPARPVLSAAALPAGAPLPPATPAAEAPVPTGTASGPPPVQMPAAPSPAGRLARWLTAQGPDPRARAVLAAVAAPVLGLTAFLALWALLSAHTRLPTPGITLASALEVYGDPLYRNGPNDQGIGWNLLASLRRVGAGFAVAALAGIPLGFLLGRFRFLGAACAPVISLLRPVSPLAWLPIGLLLFRAAEPSAVFAIFICSIWPMVINTAAGVAQVPREYLDVARVLRLSEWTVATRILLPAALPYVLTGVRLAVGIAWLVIVAAEMLTGGVGIGFWLWDEWNNLNVPHILIAIFTIGAVGFALEQLLLLAGRRLRY